MARSSGILICSCEKALKVFLIRYVLMFFYEKTLTLILQIFINLNNHSMKTTVMSALFVLLSTVYLSAQGTLQFNQAKIIGSSLETVPAGKVWKVTSVYGTSSVCNLIGPCYTALSPNSYAFAQQSGLKVNGTSIVSKSIWTRLDFYTNNTCTDNPRAFSNAGTCKADAMDQASDPNLLPMWIPAGATVSSLGNGSFVSVIEFNIIP